MNSDFYWDDTNIIVKKAGFWGGKNNTWIEE